MQIDSDSLAVFYEALLALFAIDHADAGRDRKIWGGIARCRLGRRGSGTHGYAGQSPFLSSDPSGLDYLAVRGGVRDATPNIFGPIAVGSPALDDLLLDSEKGSQ